MASNFYRLVVALSDNLERKKRGDDDIVVIKEGAPDWVTEIIREVHGKQFPNDHTFRFVEMIVDHLRDTMHTDDDLYEAEDLVYELDGDIYTTDILAWLSSNLGNVEYIADAVAEHGTGASGYQYLAMAQRIHIGEIASTLLQIIDDFANDDEFLAENEMEVD